MTEEEARAAHPAGKKMVPKAELLQQILTIVREDGWLYGVQSMDQPGRIERWDVRSIVDYVCAKATGRYALYYTYRNVIMGEIISAANEHTSDFIANYGDWRMWETNKDRTQMSIEQAIGLALQRAKVK